MILYTLYCVTYATAFRARTEISFLAGSNIKELKQYASLYPNHYSMEDWKWDGEKHYTVFRDRNNTLKGQFEIRPNRGNR